MESLEGKKVSAEVIRELRNDFNFFITMLILKSMALSSPDPKKFVRDMIWKWREVQVMSFGSAATEVEKRMFSNDIFNNIFGDFMKERNKTQREILVTSIRAFCDNIEKIIIDSIDVNDELNKENEEA